MLRLFPSRLLNYYSDNWEVTGHITHLPSITPTTIPNAGYGGFGWALRVYEKEGSDITVELYRDTQRVQRQTVDNGSECVLIPDGGEPDDYQVRIFKA